MMVKENEKKKLTEQDKKAKAEDTVTKSLDEAVEISFKLKSDMDEFIKSLKITDDIRKEIAIIRHHEQLKNKYINDIRDAGSEIKGFKAELMSVIHLLRVINQQWKDVIVGKQ